MKVSTRPSNRIPVVICLIALVSDFGGGIDLRGICGGSGDKNSMLPAKLLLGSFLVALLTITFLPIAGAQTGGVELNAAEQWVATQVAAGKAADLITQFPDREERKLSAGFLEDLLTGAPRYSKPGRIGVRISGATIDEPIDLTNAQIPCDVSLEHCRFTHAISFEHANFASGISFRNSRFEAAAKFNNMKVGSTAVFDNATFEGSASFVLARIVDNFQAIGARFENKEHSADFNSMKVGDTAFFRHTDFEGTADFLLAEIGGNFEAQNARFNDKEQGAFFYGMKVGQIASFQKAVFEGLAEFDATEIALNFEADEAQFRNQTEAVRMRCGLTASFKDAIFAGPASFQDSTFSDLLFENKNVGASVPRLDLSRTSIKGHLSMRNIAIEDFVAPWLHVEGPADFIDITAKRLADLSYGDFSTLDVAGSRWPDSAEAFHLQGARYKYISAGVDQSSSHKALLKLANRAAYNANVYSNLEEFFAHMGSREDADRVFIAGKCRERKENLHGARWLESWLLYLLVGYGRHPSQTGYLCIFFVVLGCVLFAAQKMEPQRPEDAPRVYNRFWYSLGLFLPFVDLQVDKVWKPKKRYWVLRNYVRVHILLGWILIPILLAAISGVIK